jgi:hypothetical protein
MMQLQIFVSVFFYGALQAQAITSAIRRGGKPAATRRGLLLEPQHIKSFVCMPWNGNIQYGRKKESGIA